MFIWTPASVGFRRDAEEYCHIGEQIARQIAPHLSTDAYVCDAGCGLGYTALALACLGYRTLAVDTSGIALSVLRENVELREYDNSENKHPENRCSQTARSVKDCSETDRSVAGCSETNTSAPHISLTILEDNLFSMHPREFYTDMVFSFFGSTEEILRLARQQCKGRIYIIRKTWQKQQNDTEGNPEDSFTTESLIRQLKERDIPYEETFFEIENGQPFRSLEDAAAFFMIYGHEDRLLTAEDVKDRLSETQDPTYPYYLPSKRQLGMLMVNVNDIRRNF